MTQDEIKKALECCETDWCCVCPYYKYESCETILKKDVLTLITEQEKEIERLDTDFITLECNYDKIYDEHKQHKIENENLKILNNKFRECIDYLKAEVKQSQIDVLNKVMNYINNKIENDYGDMSDSVNYLTINIDDFDDFIDELIRDVQNGEDKG